MNRPNKFPARLLLFLDKKKQDQKWFECMCNEFLFSHFPMLDGAHKSHDKHPKIHVELRWQLLWNQWRVCLVAAGAKKDYLNWFVSVDKFQAQHRNCHDWASTNHLSSLVVSDRRKVKLMHNTPLNASYVFSSKKFPTYYRQGDSISRLLTN